LGDQRPGLDQHDRERDQGGDEHRDPQRVGDLEDDLLDDHQPAPHLRPRRSTSSSAAAPVPRSPRTPSAPIATPGISKPVSASPLPTRAATLGAGSSSLAALAVSTGAPSRPLSRSPATRSPPGSGRAPRSLAGVAGP